MNMPQGRKRGLTTSSEAQSSNQEIRQQPQASPLSAVASVVDAGAAGARSEDDSGATASAGGVDASAVASVVDASAAGARSEDDSGATASAGAAGASANRCFVPLWTSTYPLALSSWMRS